MNAKKRRIFYVTAVIALALLSACRQETSRSMSESEGTGRSTEKIIIEGVTIEVLLAERLDSYQTHYMMSYPPEGEQFILVEMRIDGDADPERWGRDHLTIGEGDIRFQPYHARRVLVGTGYEYTADEDFKFHYQFFFSVPVSNAVDDLSLYVNRQKSLALADVYVGSKIQKNTPAREYVSGEFSVVAGGSENAALATHSTVSGGQLNTAGVAYATVGGGRENNASYLYTSIGGGYGNLASGRESSIGGGSRNSTTGDHAAIAGGIRNQATASDSVIAGGAYNLAGEIYAVISGGTRNLASGTAAVISGGAGNHAEGEYASVAGGLSNLASGSYSAVLAGHQNNASGKYSTVLGGFSNQAAGDFSVALGNRSLISPEHEGAFLFADSLDFAFRSQSRNEFAMRASGGVRIVTAVDSLGVPAAGVSLSPGSGSWEVLSASAAKTKLNPVESEQIFTGLMNLPLYTWSYRSDPGAALHIGPTAEDFHSRFGLGNSQTSIATVDADGVALAAIQHAGQIIEQQGSRLDRQEQQLDQLETRLGRLQVGIQYLIIANALLVAALMLSILKRNSPPHRRTRTDDRGCP